MGLSKLKSLVKRKDSSKQAGTVPPPPPPAATAEGLPKLQPLSLNLDFESKPLDVQTTNTTTLDAPTASTRTNNDAMQTTPAGSGQTKEVSLLDDIFSELHQPKDDQFATDVSLAFALSQQLSTTPTEKKAHNQNPVVVEEARPRPSDLFGKDSIYSNYLQSTNMFASMMGTSSASDNHNGANSFTTAGFTMTSTTTAATTPSLNHVSQAPPPPSTAVKVLDSDVSSEDETKADSSEDEDDLDMRRKKGMQPILDRRAADHHLNVKRKVDSWRVAEVNVTEINENMIERMKERHRQTYRMAAMRQQQQQPYSSYQQPPQGYWPTGAPMSPPANAMVPPPPPPVAMPVPVPVTMMATPPESVSPSSVSSSTDDLSKKKQAKPRRKRHSTSSRATTAYRATSDEDADDEEDSTTDDEVASRMLPHDLSTDTLTIRPDTSKEPLMSTADNDTISPDIVVPLPAAAETSAVSSPAHVENEQASPASGQPKKDSSTQSASPEASPIRRSSKSTDDSSEEKPGAEPTSTTAEEVAAIEDEDEEPLGVVAQRKEMRHSRSTPDLKKKKKNGKKTPSRSPSQDTSHRRPMATQSQKLKHSKSNPDIHNNNSNAPQRHYYPPEWQQEWDRMQAYQREQQLKHQYALQYQQYHQAYPPQQQQTYTPPPAHPYYATSPPPSATYLSQQPSFMPYTSPTVSYPTHMYRSAPSSPQMSPQMSPQRSSQMPFSYYPMPH